MQKHQVIFYLLSLFVGMVVALVSPDYGERLEPLNNPALALLLLATFICIPLRMPRGEYTFPPRFLKRLLTLNFLINPLLIWILLTFIQLEDSLAYAAALVLLAPCIDYVVVFVGIAGGAQEDLTRATPILLVCQAIAVPLWFILFTVSHLWENTPITAATLKNSLPAVAAALGVIVLPLALAWVIQRLNTSVWATGQCLAETCMVPLMMLVLFSVVASHANQVIVNISQLFPLAAVYLLFALTSGICARVLSQKQMAHPARTALIFSAVTRNSLVILPIALVIEELNGQPRVPLAVITQTLVELCVMVAMVKILRGSNKTVEPPGAE